MAFAEKLISQFRPWRFTLRLLIAKISLIESIDEILAD